ncbi:MAG: 6-phosphogluconolactonase [Bacteroidota bacterium]
MRIAEFENNRSMALMAASMVKKELKKNPTLLLCAATGNSPLPLYKELVSQSKKNMGPYRNIRLIALDEWIGLDTSKGSCDAYLRKYLVEPLGISEGRYLGFNTKANDFRKESTRMQRQLNQEGPIDLCVLGLGSNGHLGLNEPADILKPHCHVAQLAPESRKHGMLKEATSIPTKGLTLGINDILSSKRILIIISGRGKGKTKRALFTRKIDPKLPASYLWQHDNVDCLVVQ